MATPIDFGPLLRSLARVGDDLKANAPLPAPQEMTRAQALAALEEAQARVTAVSAWLVVHPGAYWAARRVLTALAAMRVTWAADALAALKAAPGALATAAIWLPRLKGFLGAIQRAPRSGPPIEEGQFWREAQTVDNPSGAIGGPS